MVLVRGHFVNSPKVICFLKDFSFDYRKYIFDMIQMHSCNYLVRQYPTAIDRTYCVVGDTNLLTEYDDF